MENIIDAAIEYVKELFKNDFSGHDYFHTMRVYNLAVAIAKSENADLEIVSLSALLHDADDAKLSPDTYDEKVNAVSFMRLHDLQEDKIDKICAIINEISFAGADSVIPESIEGKCVQDADRIDALGAIGIARAFAFGGNRNRQMYNPDIKPLKNMNNKEYINNENSTTINHFYEKLLLLKSMMNTNTAIKIAQNRDDFMRAYLDEFFAEWNGERSFLSPAVLFLYRFYGFIAQVCSADTLRRQIPQVCALLPFHLI